MGTVVAPNLVLTTAHCVEDVTTGVLDPRSGFGVITGRLDLADTASGQVSAVSELITHAVSWQTRAFPSGATSINVVGDAALVVLATPTAAPAITLADSSDLSLIQPGDTAEEAGWGLVPVTPLGRIFRDELGRATSALARAASNWPKRSATERSTTIR